MARRTFRKTRKEKITILIETRNKEKLLKLLGEFDKEDKVNVSILINDILNYIFSEDNLDKKQEKKVLDVIFPED